MQSKWIIVVTPAFLAPGLFSLFFFSLKFFQRFSLNCSKIFMSMFVCARPFLDASHSQSHGPLQICLPLLFPKSQIEQPGMVPLRASRLWASTSFTSIDIPLACGGICKVPVYTWFQIPQLVWSIHYLFCTQTVLQDIGLQLGHRLLFFVSWVSTGPWSSHYLTSW